MCFKKKERQNTTTNLLHKILSIEALNYLEEVLNYIRALVPNEIEDLILEDSYKVSLKEFCESSQIRLL